MPGIWGGGAAVWAKWAYTTWALRQGCKQQPGLSLSRPSIPKPENRPEDKLTSEIVDLLLLLLLQHDKSFSRRVFIYLVT